MLLARTHPRLRINACSPGFIETDLTRKYAQLQGKPPAELGSRAQIIVQAALVRGEVRQRDALRHDLRAGIWRPKPTLDWITWSGEALPDPDQSDCDQGFDLAVTGTWRRPNAFEVKSVRTLRW